MRLVEASDPRALAICAHVFAMTDFARDAWWLQGTAEYEVNGIASIMPLEWQWAMEWPLYIISRRQTEIETRSLPIRTFQSTIVPEITIVS
jgi:hypothetical protein